MLRGYTFARRSVARCCRSTADTLISGGCVTRAAAPKVIQTAAMLLAPGMAEHAVKGDGRSLRVWYSGTFSTTAPRAADLGKNHPDRFDACLVYDWKAAVANLPALRPGWCPSASAVSPSAAACWTMAPPTGMRRVVAPPPVVHPWRGWKHGCAYVCAVRSAHTSDGGTGEKAAAEKSTKAAATKPSPAKNKGMAAKGAKEVAKVPEKAVQKELSSKWKLTPSTVRKAFAKAQAEHGTRDLGIVFLLAKGVMHDDSAVVRKDRLASLLNPPDAEWEACRRRLDRLVQLEGDTTFDTDPEGWQTLEDFRAAVPAWKDSDIFHFREGVSLPRRHQLSGGLCYIHAPQVLQRYLVSLHQPNVGMIDMVKLIRQTYSAKQLERHVFDDGGGDSCTALETILVPKSVIVACGVNEYDQHLLKYGPALVARFRIYDDFLNAAAPSSFDGAPTGNFVGHHAMVMIGARQDTASGKRWFLLQNWWKHSQFVEVSETYLQACCSVVRFVETPQKRIPEEFPTQPHLIAENENVDKPEQLMGEYPEAPAPAANL